jgi:hypothetical protein
MHVNNVLMEAEVMSGKRSYVWYVGYGSNLCRKRFLCYICGGRFKWGGPPAKGCTDKSAPLADKPFKISHRLYFARKSGFWEDGGVAFIYPERESEEAKWTLGRMWKITYEQYKEVKAQEGCWYSHEIHLGEEEGVPILTITSEQCLTPNKPSKAYLKTIVLGIKETYNMINEDILEYLEDKDGIRNNYSKEELKKIIESVILCK